jgi:hypothetical protein
MADQDWSDSQIQEMVRGLESLRGGDFASAALIGCGPRAIEPLRRYLLQGKPRGIFQPRQLAVETLAALGARDVLLEYLQQSRRIVDPVVRFSEANVQSTAARALSHWLSDDVYLELKHLADTQLLLPGLVEALAEFRRVETVPYFLWALGDGECREAGEEALRKIGVAARPLLAEAATTPIPSGDEESPSSRIRRRKVLGILADGQVSDAEWRALRPLLDDRDTEIAAIAARIALQVGSTPDQTKAAKKLIESLPRADWFLRTYVRSCLADHYDVARPQIESEIATRNAGDDKERALDMVLRLLVNLKTQIEKAEQIGAGLCQNRK